MDKSLILKEIKTHYNFKTDSEFADYLGIKQNTLSNWVSRNSIDYERIIAKCEEINGDWLLTGEGNMLKKPPEKKLEKTTKGIPLLPLDAFAGLGDSDAIGVDLQTNEESYDIPLFYNIRVDFMITVRGSSMYPKYSSGDVVACLMVEELLYIQWNKIYVIDSFSQGILMKRLKKSKLEGSVVCKSDNLEYDEFELPMSDIRNIALVVGSVRLE